MTYTKHACYLVHTVHETDVLVVLGVVLARTELKTLANELRGAVYGPKPRPCPRPVVQTDHVDVEVQPPCVFLPVVPDKLYYIIHYTCVCIYNI